MNWLRRKNDPGTPNADDPSIDFARRALQHPQPQRVGCDDKGERVTEAPKGVDSDFCYGEESNPCA